MQNGLVESVGNIAPGRGLRQDINTFGVGICIRNEHRDFIKARTNYFHRVPRPPEVEAWTLYQVIQWTSELGISKFHAIMARCRAILPSIANSKMSFERMQANNVAHILAKTSLFYAYSQSFDNIPTCIENLIWNEKS
ncbi:hypothetical protein D0Y65_046607 [Glycine soja]|uniref:Uncharacterized protein n=1 Tax=Glycine soja TaxID=3848 RepID=A0A445G9Z4_GLYSO|nr:hypothetical protein D0Y65_046607 [Glycine soja]